MSLLRPNGCTCGEISVGGVNSPSRRQMLIELDCPWHGHLRREQDEFRKQMKKLEEPHLITIVAAIASNPNMNPKSGTFDLDCVTIAGDILRIIKAG